MTKRGRGTTDASKRGRGGTDSSKRGRGTTDTSKRERGTTDSRQRRRPEARIIKKYPNRRLYDMAESRYITVADVKDLVRRGVGFQVVDARTKKDLTRSTLLQIILEEEEDGKGAPLLTTESLIQLIRLYGDTLEGLTSDFLQGSLGMLTRQRKLVQDQVNDAVAGTPFAGMTELTRRQLGLWRELQESFLAATGIPAGGPDLSEGIPGSGRRATEDRETRKPDRRKPPAGRKRSRRGR